MHPYLRKRRTMLIRASAIYQEADSEWRAGLRAAEVLVPGIRGRGYWSIGNPGSRIRSLYDRRDRALQRLAVAMIKMNVARERLRKRKAEETRARLRLMMEKRGADL
ncbi:hypothetical protein [Cribrihabitans neustonicus]|uniref:hypothetical protein n=1 Tax=Cribrihabitans neustonicus TaxID=1429085 RepID=UPI003B5ACE0D